MKCIKLIRGNYGELACPLPCVEVYHDDADDTGATPEIIDQSPCGQSLHLIIEGAVSLSAFEADPDAIETEPEAAWFNAWVWRVECEGGHVLARSTTDGYGGDRVPFCLSWLPFTIPPDDDAT